MKSQLLCFIFILFISDVLAQTNDWYQYTRPGRIYDMQYDSSGNLHCGTDMGYIKFDDSFNVLDYKNLTTQSLPIGKIKHVAIDPDDDDFLVGVGENERVIGIDLKNGSASFMTFNSTLETYTETNLYWANSGELYIYSGSENFYQTHNNGILSPKVDVSFFPKGIVENKDGTKAYFAGAANGLWELDKTNDTWTNYTTSNSNIVSNFLTDIEIDENDVLYITSYSGLCTLENGTFTSYQEQYPSSSLYYPCFQVDIHPTTGDALVRTSLNNSAYHDGFAIVELGSNNWNFYRQDDSNCVNKNTFDLTQYTRDGSEVIAIASFQGFVSELKSLFDPATNSCTPIDFNYLNGIDLSSYSDLNVRTGKADKTIDIGITNNNGFHILNVLNENFNGIFQDASTVLSNGNGVYQYDILSSEEQFLVTNSLNQMQFIDQDNNVTTHELSGIGTGGIIKSKTAGAAFGGSQAIVMSTFNAIWERIIYIVQCNMANGTCSEGVEIFGEDRLLASNATFSCIENSDDTLLCGITKENNSSEIAIEVIEFNLLSLTSTLIFGTVVSELITSINKDIFFLDLAPLDGEANPIAHIINDNRTLLHRFEKEEGEEEVTVTSHWIKTGDDEDDEEDTVHNEDGNIRTEINNRPDLFFRWIVGFFKDVDVHGGPNAQQYIRKRFGEALTYESYNFNRGNTESAMPHTVIEDATFDNLPSDIELYKMIRYINSESDYTLILHTNYGLLLKSNIDVSFSLGIDKNDFMDNSVNLYPNPSSDSVSIETKEYQSVEVYDLNGRIVLESEKETIDIGNLAKGVYIAKVKLLNNVEIPKRLIVQ